MKKILSVFLFLLLPFSATAWERSYKGNGPRAQFNSVTSVEFFGWNTHLEGDLNVDGLKVNLGTEASIGDENRIGFKINHVLSHRSAVQLAYIDVGHTGRIDKVVTFDRRNYQAGAAMDLNMRWIDLTWCHNLNHALPRSKEPLEAFYIDGMLGIKFGTAKVKLTGRENTIAAAFLRNTWEQVFPIPYLGISAGGQLSRNVWLKGHLQYVNIDGGGNSALHADYGVNVAVRLNPNSQNTELFFDIGYSAVKFDFDNDSDSGLLQYRGPKIGFMARF